MIPYATLEPLKALLPVKRGDAIPADTDVLGGIRPGGLERRMRSRWQIISGLWDTNKAVANKLNLYEQLDYYGKLSAQLEWQENQSDTPVRVAYAGSGAPTAAVIDDDASIIDYTLFYITCKDKQEANYLLAIINSDALYEAVMPLMPKGQFGARHVQKHLWKLPIPEFDRDDSLHASLAEAGRRVAAGAEKKLEDLRKERGERLTVTIARRELRKWLRASQEGAAVEGLVQSLLQ